MDKQVFFQLKFHMHHKTIYHSNKLGNFQCENFLSQIASELLDMKFFINVFLFLHSQLQILEISLNKKL